MKTKTDSSDIPLTVYYSASSPQSSRLQYASAQSLKQSKNSLDTSSSNIRINEIMSTDFYSFESHESGESSYHTANEHEECEPKFLKHLESLNAFGKLFLLIILFLELNDKRHIGKIS